MRSSVAFFPPFDVATSLGERNRDGITKLFVQALGIADVTHAQLGLAPPRAHAIGAAKPVRDGSALHRAQPDLAVADVNAVFDDVAGLHSHAFAGDRHPEDGVRADGQGPHPGIGEAAGTIEDITHDIDDVSVVEGGVAIADDCADLTTSKTKERGLLLA